MTKAEIRRTYKAKRKALSKPEYSQRNHQIFKLFKQNFPIKQPTTVHCYLSSEEKREVSTKSFIAYLLAHPQARVVTSRSHAEGKLTHHLYTRDTILQTNQWNIREPGASEPVVPVQEIDWVLVPLLAFDRLGYRVGYGKGYYDRFLAKCRPDVVTIGLSIEPPVEFNLRFDPHDIPLRYTVTPTRVYSH